MIPVIARNGTSAKGAFLYYGHDKNAKTTERVAFTESVNLRTDDPEQAWRIMAATAQNQDRLKASAGVKQTGRKLETTVFAYSLSWTIGEAPSRADMLEAAHESLQAIGAEGYQAFMFAHQDEPHKHLHIVINRVHPETGIAFDPAFPKMHLSRWAEQYEKEHGKIHCERRVENNARRKAGEYVKHTDRTIENAWLHSDNGKSFAAALEREGYLLARGDRRNFVIVDRHGKVINPARQITGAKAKDIAAKLADLERETLQSVQQAKAKQAEKERQEQAKIEEEREDKKRREEFKKLHEYEAKKAFQQAAEEERQRIERMHRALDERQRKETAIQLQKAKAKREETEQEIEDTYRMDDTIQEIKAIQQRLKTKPTFWGKLSGKDAKQREALKREERQLKRQLAENQQKAANARDHAESFIERDHNALARRFEEQRRKLPPRPERDRSAEKGRDRDEMERSRERSAPWDDPAP